MEEYTLDFFGEKVSIKKPTDLSCLREQIIKKFSFKEEDIKDIIIYYLKEEEKQYIKNNEDFSTFLNGNIYLIYLDVDKNSKLYIDCKSNIENENIEIEGNYDLEQLIVRKKEIEKSEEEYIKSYEEKLTNLNRQLDILQAKKLDLVMSKKNKIKEYETKKEKIDKKINDLLEKENKEILKEKNSKQKTISFNVFKDILDNIVEKVKDITNEYIFKKTETTDENEKIEDIKKISKNAVEEINNLSKLVIKDIKEEKKINLRGWAKNILNEENSDLCENCENKNKHKLDHISIKTIKISNENNEVIYTGVKCKGCGAIIWNDN